MIWPRLLLASASSTGGLPLMLPERKIPGSPTATDPSSMFRYMQSLSRYSCGGLAVLCTTAGALAGGPAAALLLLMLLPSNVVDHVWTAYAVLDEPAPACRHADPVAHRTSGCHISPKLP